MDRYMLVVAHADDEVLGAGGWMFQVAERGHPIHVVIMSTDSPYRTIDGSNLPILTALGKTLEKFGGTVRILNYPDASFNVAPLRKLVEDIEVEMDYFKPSIIITHHPGDLNEDHQITSKAVQIASRKPQRHSQFEGYRIKALYFMEIPCSTAWIVDGKAPFIPDTFVQIKKEHLEEKIACVNVYHDVIRPYPHPRSELGIMTLASYRGSQIGVSFAEAFETAFRLEDTWRKE